GGDRDRSQHFDECYIDSSHLKRSSPPHPLRRRRRCLMPIRIWVTGSSPTRTITTSASNIHVRLRSSACDCCDGCNTPVADSACPTTTLRLADRCASTANGKSGRLP